VPLATLIVLAVGYRVPLFVLRPFLAPPAMMAYRWLFVLAIIGTALWFAAATARWTMRRHGRARRRLLSELRPRTGRV